VLTVPTARGPKCYAPWAGPMPQTRESAISFNNLRGKPARSKQLPLRDFCPAASPLLPRKRAPIELPYRVAMKCFILFMFLERAKGFEPSTPTLARLCSTPELHPLTGKREKKGPVPTFITTSVSKIGP
jgi:hypothetical protein